MMKKRRGSDFACYVILGACNPQLAHLALQAERDLDLLLPGMASVRSARDGAWWRSAIR